MDLDSIVANPVDIWIEMGLMSTHLVLNYFLSYLGGNFFPQPCIANP